MLSALLSLFPMLGALLLLFLFFFLVVNTVIRASFKPEKQKLKSGTSWSTKRLFEHFYLSGSEGR